VQASKDCAAGSNPVTCIRRSTRTARTLFAPPFAYQPTSIQNVVTIASHSQYAPTTTQSYVQCSVGRRWPAKLVRCRRPKIDIGGRRLRFVAGILTMPAAMLIMGGPLSLLPRCLRGAVMDADSVLVDGDLLLEAVGRTWTKHVLCIRGQWLVTQRAQTSHRQTH